MYYIILRFRIVLDLDVDLELDLHVIGTFRRTVIIQNNFQIPFLDLA
jgi:hypothetical protein